MKTDLLPRSNGEYRLGADTFAKKLRYDEMVDVPLPHLLEIAMARSAHATRQEFARVAKEVDPAKTPQEVLAELATIHPAPDKLLDAFHEHLRLADRVHPRAPHHHDPQRRAADAGGDAAVYAGDDVCFDGSAGAV